MVKSKKELEKLAKKLLAPEGKEPYYLGNRCVCNLRELHQNLYAFSEKEASQIASWIEYLGDKETAREIREVPSHFKLSITKRYAELLQFRLREAKA
jgi:hypothetical protein